MFLTIEDARALEAWADEVYSDQLRHTLRETARKIRATVVEAEQEEDPVGPVELDVTGCVRCGGDHPVYFLPFDEPIFGFTHAGSCPNKEILVFMKIVEVSRWL